MREVDYCGDPAQVGIDVWAIRVWEANPPVGEEPLEWLLLTNEPMLELTDLQRAVEGFISLQSASQFHGVRIHNAYRPTDMTDLFVRNGDDTAPKPVKLKAICHPGDEGEPVVTVMLPDED